ncbi:hypothetical protein JCM8097_005689 [Rhodosporidiobolus ruineniae]
MSDQERALHPAVCAAAESAHSSLLSSSPTSDSSSAYLGPGHGVYSLAFQSFSKAEREKMRKEMPGSKEKNLQKKVEKAWEKTQKPPAVEKQQSPEVKDESAGKPASTAPSSTLASSSVHQVWDEGDESD